MRSRHPPNRRGNRVDVAGAECNESGSVFRPRAVSCASNKQAKSWELRATISIARLWRDQGGELQPTIFSRPIYGWFTEGFDTAHLKDAKALLEELV